MLDLEWVAVEAVPAQVEAVPAQVEAVNGDLCGVMLNLTSDIGPGKLACQHGAHHKIAGWLTAKINLITDLVVVVVVAVACLPAPVLAEAMAGSSPVSIRAMFLETAVE